MKNTVRDVKAKQIDSKQCHTTRDRDIEKHPGEKKKVQYPIGNTAQRERVTPVYLTALVTSQQYP